jgi:ketosteroid isomerase-like protein
MSSENVELTKEAFERFNRGDDDEGLLEDLFDPDAGWHVRADEPDAAVHRGRESIQDMWRTWDEMFDPWEPTAEEYIDAGDFVIAPGWLSGIGRESGVTVREPYTWVFTWRDGKVVEVREYHTKAEALEALRLRGQAAPPTEPSATDPYSRPTS